MSEIQDELNGEDGVSHSLLEFEGESRVISARGTEDGLVLRIDGRAEWVEILRDIELFLGSRKKFFDGAEVFVEWLDRLPTKEQSQELEVILLNGYGIRIATRRRKNPPLKRAEFAKGSGNLGGEPAKAEAPAEKLGTAHLNPPAPTLEGVSARSEKPSFDEFFDSAGFLQSTSLGSELSSGSEPNKKLAGFGIRAWRNRKAAPAPTSGVVSLGGLDEEANDVGRKYVHHMASILGEEVFYDEDANAKVVFGTLRSGQRVESPFSLIVVGDVNPGADVISGGDIIILGSLRGTAHAAAYDEESFNRSIIALHMQPMQLRIGSVISRGSDDIVHGMEIAHIEDRRIVVEPYHPKILIRKKA